MSVEKTYKNMVLRDKKRTIQEMKAMQDKIAQSNLLINNKPIPFFFKPFFLSKHKVFRMKKLSEKMSCILNKITKHYAKNRALLKTLGYDDYTTSLIRKDPGYENPVALSRLDLLISKNEFKFIEFNTDGPAAMGHADVGTAIFMETETFKKTNQKYVLEPWHLSSMLAEEIVTCYKQFGGEKDYPVIAFVELHPVPSDAELTKNIFRKNGFDAFTVDPRELKYKSGKLWFKGKEIDVVYKRAISKELMQCKPRAKHFLAAVKDGKTCVVNNFQSLIPDNKKMLWLLKNRYFKDFLNCSEQKLVEKHLPWTCSTTEKNVEYNDKEHSLKKLLLGKKDSFVIKHASSYGGADVFIGCGTPKARWVALVKKALASKDFIVQEHLIQDKVEVPLIQGKDVVFEEVTVNSNPYVFNNKFAGVLTRASHEGVVNLHHGGGIMPSFVYDKRRTA